MFVCFVLAAKSTDVISQRILWPRFNQLTFQVYSMPIMKKYLQFMNNFCLSFFLNNSLCWIFQQYPSRQNKELKLVHRICLPSDTLPTVRLNREILHGNYNSRTDYLYTPIDVAYSQNLKEVQYFGKCAYTPHALPRRARRLDTGGPKVHKTHQIQQKPYPHLWSSLINVTSIFNTCSVKN